MGRTLWDLPIFCPGDKLTPLGAATKLYLSLDDRLIPMFFQLLQKGFMIKAHLGCSIKSLLCQQLDLSPEYLKKRVQTIFLDGKPVDDVDSTIVNEGSTLALSAAMPGLVGAIFRRGSRYAHMRSQISRGERIKSSSVKEAMVSLKLFNILLRELGPAFLNRGIWVKGKDLEDLFKRQSTDFWAGCKVAKVDGEKVDLHKLSEIEWTDEEVYLQVGN